MNNILRAILGLIVGFIVGWAISAPFDIYGAYMPIHYAAAVLFGLVGAGIGLTWGNKKTS